jgi:hypothetical protein
VAESLGEGVSEKLRRAHLYRKEIERRIDRFIKSHAYDTVRKTDVETGQHLWIGKIRKQPPLIRWGALIGDCLFNFRSALDHLAYDLAVAYSGFPLDPDVEFKSEFPIFWRRQITTKELSDKLGAVDPDARNLIVQMQPYGRKDRAALKYLDSLQNFDKHRTLHLVQATAVSVGWYGNDPFRTEDGIDGEVNLAPFKDGDVIARSNTTPSPKTYNDPVFSFGIAFSSEGPGSGYEVNLMLSWIAQHIEKGVIAPLLPYL